MKGCMRYSLLCIAVVFLLPCLAFAQSDDLEESFFKANQAYKEGRFEEAAEGYEALIEAGYTGSGDLFFNLGNTCFRLDKLGWAIVNYERALILIPRDADLNFNLRMAKDQLIDAVEEPKNFMGTALFWVRSFNLSELFRGFAVLNILFWGILTIRLFKRSEWNYYLSISIPE